MILLFFEILYYLELFKIYNYIKRVKNKFAMIITTKNSSRVHHLIYLLNFIFISFKIPQ